MLKYIIVSTWHGVNLRPTWLWTWAIFKGYKKGKYWFLRRPLYPVLIYSELSNPLNSYLLLRPCILLEWVTHGYGLIRVTEFYASKLDTCIHAFYSIFLFSHTKDFTKQYSWKLHIYWRGIIHAVFNKITKYQICVTVLCCSSKSTSS